jgi:hypothetical protein
MSMSCDNHNFYNRFSAHDDIVSACQTWAEFYNFLASLECNTDVQRQQYLYEMSEYLIYDV